MKTYNQQILQHRPDESKTQVFQVREKIKNDSIKMCFVPGSDHEFASV